MAKQRILSIKEIYFDMHLYPRKNIDNDLVVQYSEAMKHGVEFPPILVGMYHEKLYLVDGWHRVRAADKNKEKNILAIIKEYENEKDLYVDAIKSNNTHGKPLTYLDKTDIIEKLKNMNVPISEISSLVYISDAKITNILNYRKINTPNSYVDLDTQNPTHVIYHEPQPSKNSNDKHVVVYSDQYHLYNMGRSFITLSKFKESGREPTNKQREILLKIKNIVDELLLEKGDACGIEGNSPDVKIMELKL